MSKFANLEENFNKYSEYIDNGDVESAKKILLDNYPMIPKTVANNSETTRRHLFYLGSLGNKAKEIFDILVENIDETKKERILGIPQLTWEDVKDYKFHTLQYSVAPRISEKTENAKWFLDVVLNDMLTSDNPNTKYLKTMYPDEEFDLDMEVLEYYKQCIRYAVENNVDAVEMIKVMIKKFKFLYYFLCGEEYEILFKSFFDKLSESQRITLIELAMNIKGKSEEDILGIIYLLRKLDYNDSENKVFISNYSTDLFKIVESINLKSKEYSDNVVDEYNRLLDEGYVETEDFDDDHADELREKFRKLASDKFASSKTEIDNLKEEYNELLLSAIQSE